MKEDCVADVVYDSDHKFKSISIDGVPIHDAKDLDIQFDGRYKLKVFLQNGEYNFNVDRLNYQILTEEEEKEMTKEDVKITVKRSEPNPPPVESVTIELTPDQASVLRYFFGRLSLAKVRTSIEGSGALGPNSHDPEAVHLLTATIYGRLLEEGI